MMMMTVHCIVAAGLFSLLIVVLLVACFVATGSKPTEGLSGNRGNRRASNGSRHFLRATQHSKIPQLDHASTTLSIIMIVSIGNHTSSGCSSSVGGRQAVFGRKRTGGNVFFTTTANIMIMALLLLLLLLLLLVKAHYRFGGSIVRDF
jgi:preprotein translocase subunit SecG